MKPPLITADGSFDRKALEAIFDDYAPVLYKYLLRLGEGLQEADPMVGDVFVRLIEKIAGGKGPHTNLRSHLYQTVYHIIVVKARAEQRITPFEQMDSLNGEKQPLQSTVEKLLLLENLSAAIQDELTENQRNVIVLQFQEGFDIRETAEIIGKRVNAVKVIQNRGIKRLHQVLDSQYQ